MSGVFIKLQELMEGLDWKDVKQFCTSHVIAALVVGVSVSAWWLLFKKPRGLPPGPSFTLPLIGDLLSLGDSPGGDIRQPFRQLRKKYGDIYSLYIGSRLCIVISGYEMIKEALVKKGDEFSGRPSYYILDSIFRHKGIFFSSGQLWKEERAFALETLRKFGFGKTILEDKIHEEIGFYVDIIGKSGGKPYDMCRVTHSAISNVISSLVYGQRFDYENPDFKEFLERMDENCQTYRSTEVLNFLPILRFLPGDLFKHKRILRNWDIMETNIIKRSINEHKDNYDENNTNDYISSYLKAIKKMEKTGQKTYMEEDNLIKSISDLFVAGTETTSTTILWTILFFLHNPNLQAKCYKEVQDVVGSGRQPSLKDRDSMQYTQAIILEVLRFANVVTLGVTHSVLEDTMFRGYLIPKDTVVIPNLDSVLSDDNVWGDADVFRPERFLDDNGQVVKREEFIPFSAGRRVCLGESLAKMEIFLFLTTLVQRFEFRPVDPKNPPTLTGKFGLIHAPSRFDVLATPRI